MADDNCLCNSFGYRLLMVIVGRYSFGCRWLIITVNCHLSGYHCPMMTVSCHPFDYVFTMNFNVCFNKRNKTEITERCVDKSVKWLDDNVQVIKERLCHNEDRLTEIVTGDFGSQSGVNATVNNFCDVINDVVLPLCDVHSFRNGQSETCRDGTKKRVLSDSKPWFNETCKRRYKEYKTALFDFNRCKSNENYRILMDKKSTYKKLEIKLKRQYKRHDGDMKEYLRKHNPRQFHKFFAKRKKHVSGNVSLDQFVEHFSEIGNQANVADGDFNNVERAVFDELDECISEAEIVKAIDNLKRNKCCGEDCILNEFFKDCKEIILPYLLRLFNCVFMSGFFPESWSTGCIVPIYKKGDVDDTNNYRGITLISCLGKLFTSILNRRLLEWDKTHNILTDAQFGFRPGHSTVDAIFVLQSLINRTLKKRGG